ncbi:MAG: hypothetical protein H8E44_10110 [Planctomycetes bacterium]|nr:hypothetical protein [Planctomycetota bacterium]MBL7038789.1 hypothetical protein [Pirellulaceae bacterium]
MLRCPLAAVVLSASVIVLLPGPAAAMTTAGTCTRCPLVALTRLAQVPQQPDRPGPDRPQMGGGGLPAIPGLEALASPHVQRELELVDEQKHQLRQVAHAFVQQMQQAMAEIQQLPMDERRERMAEMQQKMKKRAEDVRREVEKILVPEQMEILENFNRRARREAVLKNPQVLAQLGISEQQKKKLRQVREEMQQRLRELENETLDKVFDVLTSEQADKLKEMIGDPREGKKRRR